jgi:hypothetical protein
MEREMFSEKPMCEICVADEATSFSYIPDNTSDPTGEWKFVCDCTKEIEDYYIYIEDFFSIPPVTVDWMAHMHEKNWMDWGDFMDMMTRFKIATNG